MVNSAFTVGYFFRRNLTPSNCICEFFLRSNLIASKSSIYFLLEAFSRSHYSLFRVLFAAAKPPRKELGKSSDMPFDRG